MTISEAENRRMEAAIALLEAHAALAKANADVVTATIRARETGLDDEAIALAKKLIDKGVNS